MGAYFDYPKDLGNSTVRRDALVRQRMADDGHERLPVGGHEGARWRT